jgi:hypothetical protein
MSRQAAYAMRSVRPTWFDILRREFHIGHQVSSDRQSSEVAEGLSCVLMCGCLVVIEGLPLVASGLASHNKLLLRA